MSFLVDVTLVRNAFALVPFESASILFNNLGTLGSNAWRPPVDKNADATHPSWDVPYLKVYDKTTSNSIFGLSISLGTKTLTARD